MRHFLSKAIAGGLSAALVLLWCPLLFPADSLDSWLVRGVAWTILFELLLHSLAPFEESVWDAAESRFGDRAKRRTLRRAAPVASVALAAAAVMLLVGAHRPAPIAADAERRVKVVQVTKVVRPVTVRRVVEAPAPAAVAPVEAEVPVAPAPARVSQAPDKPKRRTRQARDVDPAPPKVEIGETAPEERTPVCTGTCAEPVPAAGSTL